MRTLHLIFFFSLSFIYFTGLKNSNNEKAFIPHTDSYNHCLHGI